MTWTDRKTETSMTRETRPALGPKVLIVKVRVPPVCGETISSSSKNDVLVISTLQMHVVLTLRPLACTACCICGSNMILPIAVPGHVVMTLFHVMSWAQYGTVSYQFCNVICKNLRWNLLPHNALYNAHWRSSSLVKNLQRQWRNRWCLTRCLAISVASQVPIFFGFSIWCKFLASDIGL